MTNNKSQIIKVLFVASGNKKVGQVNSFVRSQYDSLEKEGQEMRLFPVVGHGVMGYLKAVVALREVIRQEKPDVIHAHYSVCGHVAVLACLGLCHKPKIVVSILGSFPAQNRKWKLVRYCVQNLWDATIVKSQRTANQLGVPVHIIPNGVNLDVFHPMDHAEARKAVGFEDGSKYIIWCSNPYNRPEKNWALAEAAVKLTNGKFQITNATLVAVYDKSPQEVAIYMNAADCLLLTSDSEGSPNVIKEAMACNCPIVTTNVGDVTERLEALDGCYIVEDNDCRFTDRNKAAVLTAEEIVKALEFGKRTDGLKRIQKDGLEITQIARRIRDVYEHL